MREKAHILFLNQLSEELLKESNAVRVSCTPLIEITDLSYDSSGWNREIPWVFTSRNASKNFKASEFPTKVYAIGKRTATNIPNAILPYEPTAKALVDMIVENGEVEVLFICGDQRREELPKCLVEAGVKVNEEAVYRTTILSKTIDLKGVDALAFMSPSSVVGLSQNGGFKNLPCFAIGPSTAQVLSELGQDPILSCKTSAESLIDKAKEYFLGQGERGII